MFLAEENNFLLFSTQEQILCIEYFRNCSYFIVTQRQIKVFDCLKSIFIHPTKDDFNCEIPEFSETPIKMKFHQQHSILLIQFKMKGLALYSVNYKPGHSDCLQIKLKNYVELKYGSPFLQIITDVEMPHYHPMGKQPISNDNKQAFPSKGPYFWAILEEDNHHFMVKLSLFDAKPIQKLKFEFEDSIDFKQSSNFNIVNFLAYNEAVNHSICLTCFMILTESGKISVFKSQEDSHQLQLQVHKAIALSETQIFEQAKAMRSQKAFLVSIPSRGTILLLNESLQILETIQSPYSVKLNIFAVYDQGDSQIGVKKHNKPLVVACSLREVFAFGIQSKGNSMKKEVLVKNHPKWVQSISTSKIVFIDCLQSEETDMIECYGFTQEGKVFYFSIRM